MKKKILAALLSGLVIINSFNIPVLAENENTETSEQQTSVLGELKESNNDSEAVETAEDKHVEQELLLNYVLVDNPCIFKDEVQNIVVSVGNGAKKIDKAQITYFSELNQDLYTVECAKIEKDGVLFNIPCNISEKDCITIKSVTISVDGEAENIDLEKIGINAQYGVNQEIDTKNDAEIVNEASETLQDEKAYSLDIVKTDENGNNISNTTIEDAIASQNDTEETLAKSGNRNVVVVLDPGHDDTHAGATGNNLHEEKLTFKIAQYCKAELEKYSGVQVYMTRNSTACPHPGTNSGDDNLMRVQYAKSVGANVYVSIHLNSSNGAAHGVEVYYPNRNYNVNVSNQGSALANDIISQLTGLGLYNRGTQIKYSSDYKYDDGSTADYYSVIRNSKKSGFPAVIVEHAFITNGSDASNYLSSDAQLQKLGVADARGIVNYFGLSKGIDTAKVSVSGALNGAKDKYEVTARGLSGASQVKFAVWSAQNGQDDLRWYTGVRNGSDWRYSVPILNHKGLGTYNIHTYAVFDDGSQQNVAQNSFYVSDVLSSNIKIANMNTVSGYFDVQVSGVVSTYGVRGVQLAVWTNKNGQDDLRWYTATYKGNGIYSAHIDVSNHKCEWGIYNVHTYITNEKNTRKCVNMNKFNVTQTKVSLSTTRNATWSQYSAAAWHVPGTLGSALKEVKFAVWSAENGQDDLHWYKGNLSGDKYIASIPMANHKSTGTYYIHTYAFYKNGTSQLVNTSSFYEAPSSCNVSIRNLNTVSGNFDVIISNIFSPQSFNGISVPVWCDKNQRDIKWYTPTRQNDGTYKVHVDAVNHNCHWGRYSIHVYVKNGFGKLERAGVTAANMSRPATIASANANMSTGNAGITVWHVPGTLGSALKSVRFAVWSAENGQDDLRWYNASQSGDRYNASLSFSNHNDSVGTYNVHVYADYRNGTSSPVATTTFFVDGYKIMGRSSVNADKLVAYYNKHASYPAFYAGTDAPNLKAFCQMYIDECAAEDVKAEVAFAQAMKETNYLRYGGDVRINQFNFAGIGATGAVSGASFPNVRTGIRAQVQHLKAYASKETLKKSCVDPRFSYVTRGSAVYVEWLGIHENPKGNGWASDHNYGYSIRKEYINKI